MFKGELDQEQMLQSLGPIHVCPKRIKIHCNEFQQNYVTHLSTTSAGQLSG